MASRYNYLEMKRLLAAIVADVRILSGEDPMPSDVTWRDVAGTLSCNMHTYSKRLENARETCNHPLFPTLKDAESEQ